ncbi:MAG: hypothetical protein V2I97_03675 [Desulfococcaceae bacterium]|jgi:Holliday junction resolvase-like predicted endonuclease|nr:hypothetical protein [Desulfococcaceae bacterium]
MYEDTEIEERVDKLEYILGDFIVQTNTGLNRLSREMREFKNEMSDFKNEMREFKKEVREDQRRMNKKWGELANKMGTLVEDIIAPAVRPVTEKYFNCEILSFFVNIRKKDKTLGLTGEFDVIAASDEYVFLVETKSRPKKQHIGDFLENTEKFRKLFPEYADRKLIPLFSSLRFDDDMIALANQEKIYLLAFREWEYMDILNFAEIKSD